ncbi:MAG TPA: family 10 glycosylhydrolase, partial [Rhodothermales bacterium]|nr:family 10 glycosylhydrolase [Rhodothermales bacterium]
MKYIPLLFAVILLNVVAPSASAQPEPLAKYEFRGAWIATVINLDWPNSPTSSTQAQQAQLITMLDELKESGINAVLFQVRSEADAMYASEIEPWSYWLTGEQGVAPDPFYDPLAFAIEEAHKRGMELHAWFNPYRAVRGSGYPNAPSHVSVEHPEWILTLGGLQVLDPGLPDVRDHNARVIADVARRYDIDGVHFDDYFYPYPPNQITNEDDATFAAHNRGFTNRGAWRRDNVNLFVAQVYDSLQVIRPSASFGISPFGIWKNGVPSGITGLDAYNVIYGDAVAWLDAQIIDYV